LEAEGLGPESIAVIPNGVSPAFLAPVERRLTVRTILTVANLRAEKSHETLLAAAAAMVGAHPELRFQIVGDGPRRGELEQRSAALGLGAHVEFLGHREDVPALLAAADLFVLPSRSEAFPNGAIEAMAAGLPVVACAVGGLLDLIEDGRTGLLVPAGDAEALGRALESLVTQPERANAMGAAARRAVEQQYSFDRMVDSFEDLYRSGLARYAPVRTHAEAAGI
ncbi:MAG: glycosyltransferase family 4 protein, partial [Acidobacteriota bacterium]|nr:glycosyltransferase family 4 protein [Acidobacteriota bacterium]